MAVFTIQGGYPLSGTIVPQGAKNEALQVICATLLTDEEVTIHNVPNISDVQKLIDLLREIGVKVVHHQKPQDRKSHNAKDSDRGVFFHHLRASGAAPPTHCGLPRI